jgi:ATP-dependent DNA helicase RecQ
MLATKAFGMGIDINDIEIVAHFAPTGNVCDYVQEIGRAARQEDLRGEAFYHYNSKDFKHINRLHGLSQIQKYQLIEVIKKIDELYTNNSQKKGDFSRKRNAMLLDAENFTYIFGNPINDDTENVNKVKTALLIIQKDFESKIGFSPINVRPIPLFSMGYFAVKKKIQSKILKRYPNCLEEIESSKNICRVHLDKIWRKDYATHSFPKFKYLLYTNDSELKINSELPMTPVMCVSVAFADDYDSTFKNIWGCIKGFIGKKVISGDHTAVSEIAEVLEKTSGVRKYKARAICEVIIASMDSYRKNYARMTTPIAIEKTTTSGSTKYQFNVAVNSYFSWVEKNYKKILSEVSDGELYLINEPGNSTKEIGVVLGILEALDVLSFKMIGGANSQLYIYINQIQGLKNILNAPNKYENRLLKAVSERHLISVKMLTYLYESDFTNEQTWDYIEDYFLGKIPEKVKRECLKERSDMKFD